MARYRRYRRSRRSYRRSYKRRSYGNRRRYRRSIRRMPVGGFGPSRVARLKYVDEIVLDVSSVSTYQTYAANGCYDVDITGAGHQPKGFDQNMALYNNYTVLGSKITAKFIPSSASNAIPAYTALLLSNSPNPMSGITSVTKFFESRYNQSGPHVAGSERGYLGQSNTLVKTFSPYKYWKRPAMDPTFLGTSTANPQDLAYFSLCLMSISANNPGPLTFLVEIDYLVKFTEPIDFSES